MAPLVEAMHKEGKSVALAPEGTRSISPRLSRFKKGAFHLAMQAGVPMIPVVIRNAGDVAPKGDFVFRPATVDVEVLEPVDTSQWQTDTIDDHVREVRNLFLEALGQPLEPEPRSSGRKPQAAAKTKTKAKAKTKTKTTAKTKSTKPAKAKSPAKKAAVKKPAAKKASPKKSAAKKARRTPAKSAAKVKPKLRSGS